MKKLLVILGVMGFTLSVSAQAISCSNSKTNYEDLIIPEASNSTNKYYQNYVLTDEIAKLCGLTIHNDKTEILKRYQQGDLINSGTSVTFVASLIMTIIIAIFIVLIFLSLIERLFFIFMGIIFCVYFACSHALDGGSRWKEYRNSLVAKSFAIMIIIVTLNHAPWLAKRLDNVINLKTKDSGFLALLVLLACLLSVMKIAGVVESKILIKSVFEMEENLDINWD